MRVVAAGGAGFIGRNLTRALCAAGAEIAVVDNLSTGRDEGLAPMTVADIATLDRLPIAAEVVFNPAWKPRRTRDPRDGGDRRAACKQVGIDRSRGSRERPKAAMPGHLPRAVDPGLGACCGVRGWAARDNRGAGPGLMT
jgi:NAD(P)-dependent dehydrogenase (short-subunit alcohol dehydrogenase family)